MAEWWGGLGSMYQIIILSMIAGGFAKLWAVVVELVQSKMKSEQTEDQRVAELEDASRADMLRRIERLENDRSVLQRTVNKLEKDMGRTLGIVLQFRLCSQQGCPTLKNLRENGDLAWLDKQIADRSNGGGIP